MKVLIIEDDAQVLKFVQRGLEAESVIVDTAMDGPSGVRQALLEFYDIVLLDLRLPEIDGYEVAKRIREKKKHLPIMILSAEAHIDMKVKLLGICDDYMTKPYSFKELFARIKTIIKRGVIVYSDIIEVGELRMDCKRFIVTRKGRELHLRNKEFSLLKYLMQHAGLVLSRTMILDHVWDMNINPMTNTVDVHIRNLRQKVDAGFKKQMIRSVPKRGYKLVP